MAENITGKIEKVSGPLVVATDMRGARMYDVVRVGEARLIGEIIELENESASIQVYEETSGLKPGDVVVSIGSPLAVTLGPGILNNIYDGIQRPLKQIMQESGAYIGRGIEVSPLDNEKKWDFKPTVMIGDKVQAGDTIGTVQETESIIHNVMVPPFAPDNMGGAYLAGTITKIEQGSYAVTDPIAILRDDEDKEHKLTMMQQWPIRKPRPVKKKVIPWTPLITGQRVIDTLFPMAKGGAGAIPGPFGSGKSVTQQQIAKWADADVIVYIGCGERGNEMTDVLLEFPELEDPRTKKPLMQRTVLIANTSNMPVAAREASVYTGITIAEYYRDMGYNVALMADSTSRWAEALREISGRLEEMPGDEGYPAYLGSRTAQFYERAGIATVLGHEQKQGSLTVIGAVSPPGGDLSEPVTQNTLRVAKVFWGLDEKLAYSRHYPAINWLTSYTLYFDQLADYYAKNAGDGWGEQRREALSILQEENSLEEVVRLVGLEALSKQEQVLMHVARSLREDYLQQNAYDEVDTYTSLNKQYRMMRAILHIFHSASEHLKTVDFAINDFLKLPIWEHIGRIKMTLETEVAHRFDKLEKDITVAIQSLTAEDAEDESTTSNETEEDKDKAMVAG